MKRFLISEQYRHYGYVHIEQLQLHRLLALFTVDMAYQQLVAGHVLSTGVVERQGEDQVVHGAFYMLTFVNDAATADTDDTDTDDDDHTSADLSNNNNDDDDDEGYEHPPCVRGCAPDWDVRCRCEPSDT
eukprot:2426035-Heterocapsa_arctica.AAC.1